MHKLILAYRETYSFFLVLKVIVEKFIQASS